MDRLQTYVPDLALTWRSEASGAPWQVRHASMLFADLSGFTRLSERVARVKGAGAEVVKRTINAVFEPCIDAVLREGGDVVKFAGDGLMIMFEGDGHPLAAARAAIGLRAAVQRIGSVRTPAGPARIGVSIGISTGLYLCLMSRVGRLEPAVVGPALDSMFAAESFAKSGQVVVDDAMAAALPAGTTAPVRGSTWRQLRYADARLAPLVAPPARRAPVRAPAEFMEARVAATVGAGETPPEHRSAAIAFLALDGLGAVRAEAGDGGLHAHVERFFAAVHEACAATDVCWLESDADRDQVRVMLTAGAPYRTDIDEQRMLDAVWRVHTACEGLPVRAGVSRGRVFVGDVGHPLRRTYNVMGDAVNVAARLCGKAAHGEVLALESVVAARRSMASAEPKPPLAVKGKKLPLAVCRIVGLAAPRPVDADEGAAAPLVGRAGELAQLTELMTVGAATGRAVVVMAEPGFGSSSLVREIASRWPGSLATTAAYEFERSTPFATASRLVRSALGIDVAADPDTVGAALTEIVSRHLPGSIERVPLVADAVRAVVPSSSVVDAIRPEFRLDQSVSATVALLRASIARPALFVVDDADLADAASAALFRSLADAAADEPWVVVATQRPADATVLEGSGVEVTTMQLAPLPDADVRDLVVATAGDVGMVRADIDRIVTQAAGNPMIARELTLGWVAGARDVELPDAVERAVAGRIDNLPPRARTMLRDLAVAGTGTEWSLVRAVLGDDADDAATWSTIAGYAVRDAGALRFEREIYAVAAYQGLAHARRQQLHRSFARELADRPYARFEAARIADHAHRGEDHELAWTWSLAAGRAAAASGAAADAALHLAHAVRAVDRGAAVGPTEIAAVVEELGDVCERAGDPDGAHAAYRRARRSAVDVRDQVRLLRKHARVAERAGAWTSSLRWVARALTLVPDDDASLLAERAELELTAGVVRFFQGRLDRSLELGTRAAGHAERAGAMRPLAQAHLQLEMCCSELGTPERAAHGLRALELFETLDDALGLANLRLNLGISCYNQGRWDEALSHYARSVAEYARVGDSIGAAATQCNRAELLTDQGRIDEAAEVLAESRRAVLAARYQLGVAITSSNLGRVALRRGDLDAADEWLQRARREFDELDSPPLVVDTDVRRCELRLWRRDLAGVLADADDLRRDVGAHGAAPVLDQTVRRLVAWAETGSARAGSRATWATWVALVDAAREPGFTYELALALDGLVAAGGAGRDPSVVAERDQWFSRLGIVVAPRPPWFDSVPRRGRRGAGPAGTAGRAP